MFIRVISWLMSFLWTVVRGGLPPSPSLPLLVCLFLSCSPSTDSPPSEEETVRERVEVSGSIVEDAVWESGKEYVVAGDVIVEGEAIGCHIDDPAGCGGKVYPVRKGSVLQGGDTKPVFNTP